MDKISDKTLVEQLNWRYATKRFDSTKKISDGDWKTLAETIRLTPSSYGLQPWKVLLVQNAAKRKELRAVSWNQPQIEECSHLVVFATLKTISEKYVKEFIALTAKERGMQPEQLKDYEAMMVGDVVKGPRSEIAQFWAQRQAYIAMGFLLETAALKGIDSCPMEGLDPNKYDEILGLKGTEYATVAVVTLGYRAADDKYQSLKKVRFSSEQVVQVIA